MDKGKTLRTADDLIEAGLVQPERRAGVARVLERYAVAIPPAMAELIDPQDLNDPIARQFVPDERELDVLPDELADPIGDHIHSPVPGVVHRHPDRVLLKIVGVCPVYCRFCFRREMVGPSSGRNLTREEVVAALDYIRCKPGIWEVILTGGDPLMLSPQRVREITGELSLIPHVKVLRWHTRMPVVTPERITPALIEALRSTERAVWIAIHANHPRELTPAARGALVALANAGIGLVSQTPLLKGINDDAATIEALMRALVECRVRPEYLFHADLAPGTSHLRSTIETGREIMRQLRGRLSGLAQPVFVLDIPGAHGKVPIGPEYLKATADGYEVLDPDGIAHAYRDTGRE